MSYHLTLFDSLYDNKTSKCVIKRDWYQFEEFLRSLYEIEYKTKKGAPLISPAVFKEGTTRANKNVIAWGGWSAIDVDSHSFKTVEEIIDFFEKTFHDSRYILYSTPTSRIEKIKFRAVFDLGEWITESSEIRAFWFSLNKKLSKIVDEQTKDLARMFFPPGNYKNDSTCRFFISSCSEKPPVNYRQIIDEGGYYNACSILDENKKIVEQLPEKLKNAVEQYRRRKIENTHGKNYSWTSYKDCPFVDKQAVLEYNGLVRSGAEGRYRMFYILMISIAGRAIQHGYPITEIEVDRLVKEIDKDIDGYYQNRRIEPEIKNAISYAYTRK